MRQTLEEITLQYRKNYGVFSLIPQIIKKLKHKHNETTQTYII
jgi:hypothetical protein